MEGGLLGRLAALVVRRPVAASMAFALFSLLGVLAWQRLPVQLLPDFALPTLHVQASWPGASPEALEKSVVRPLEGEIATLRGVAEIRSELRLGSASLEVSFARGTDLDVALLEVRQRLGALKDRVPDSAFLDVQRFDSSQFRNFVMVLSFRGDAEPQDLKEMADDVVVPALTGVPGVVQVVVQGGASFQVGATVDPARVRAHGLSVLAVRSALAGVSQPVTAVGTVTSGARSLPVVLDGRAKRLSDVSEAPVVPGGAVKLGSVADIALGLAGSVERYRVDGKSSLGLLVFKDQEANLLEVSTLLRARVAEWNAERAADGLVLAIDVDAAESIEEGLDSLLKGGLAGAALGLLVLLAFLGDLRPVAAVALAVPVSLLMACDLFAMTGMSLNVLSLLGLALAVGMLVDNSVVVLEAIAARRERGDSPVDAARRGTASVARAVLASTATTLAVFVPLAFLDWEFAPLLEEIALSVSYPLVASLAVALLLVPVLATRLSPRPRADHAVRLPGIFGWPRPGRLRAGYSALLRLALRHAGLTLVIFLGVIIASLVIAVPLVMVFVEPPRPPQERILMVADLPAGTPVETVDEIARQLEALAGELPELDQVQASVREGEARVTAVFKEQAERQGAVSVPRARERLRKQVAGLEKAAEVEVDPPPDTPAAGGSSLASESKGEIVRVSGPAGTDIEGIAAVLLDQLARVGGVSALTSDLVEPRPTLDILPDRRSLAEHGLSTQDLLAVIWATRREGEPMRHPVLLGDRSVDLVLWIEGASSRTVEGVRDFPLITSTGARIPLTRVASVRRGAEPPVVRRFQRERSVELSWRVDPEVTTTGEDADAVRRAVDRVVQSVPLPAGVHVDVLHADEQMSEVKKLLYLALALVFLVLAVSFESLVLPFLVMLCVPLAAVGAAWVLALTGTSVNEMVVLALAVLLGVSVNNGILFIDRVQELAAQRASLPASVLRAAHDRLRPMLMTAGTTVIGMVPLSISHGGEQEIWPPFGRAVIGGLLAATLISLVFLPAGTLVLARLERLLLKLRLPAVLATTAAVGLLLWWLYFEAQVVLGTPMRWLLPLPVWLLALAIVRALQALVRGERPPQVVGDGPVDLRVRSLRKVYGGLPRVFADAALPERWLARARGLGLSPADMDPPRAAAQRLACLVGTLALSAYLGFVAEGAWGRLLLTLPLVPLLAATVRAALAAIGRPLREGGLQGWSGRLLRAVAVSVPWWLAYVSRREDSGPDLVVLIAFGILLGAAALLHLVVPGGALALIRRRVAPAPVTALAGVDLEFQPGLYGLLGPNGAGKSTLMRLIVNLFRPTRGRVTVNGHELGEHAASLQRSIGYLPQFFAVPPRLSARSYLHHHALLAGHSGRAERTALVEQALADVGLEERGDEALGGYSGGMRQRVGIARTLLDAPRILVVDEPTVGLDPRERVRFRNLLGDLAKTRIVLLSTHVVEDIGSACREVIVLGQGSVLFRGSPAALAEEARGRAFTLELSEDELPAASAQHRIVSTAALPGGRVRARAVGEPPEGAMLVAPSLEDGYLLLLARHGAGGLRAA